MHFHHTGGPHLEPVRWKIIPCSKQRFANKTLRSESLDVCLISSVWGISCEMEWYCLMCQVLIKWHIVVHIIAIKQTFHHTPSHIASDKIEANPVGWNMADPLGIEGIFSHPPPPQRFFHIQVQDTLWDPWWMERCTNGAFHLESPKLSPWPHKPPRGDTKVLVWWQCFPNKGDGFVGYFHV